MKKIIKNVSHEVTKATHPIEEQINKATNNQIKDLGGKLSHEVTGKGWKQGLGKNVRKTALSGVGNVVGGPTGSVLGGKAADVINEDM